MTGVPIELERDPARRLARQELADPIYDTEPPLLQQVMDRILAELNDLIRGAAGAMGGWGGLIVLGVLAAIVAIILLRYRRLDRRGAVPGDPVFTGARRSAASYRAAAEAAEASGDWSTSVLERYRAIVTAFEERAVLEPRPGRTADEAAREAGPFFPDLRSDLFSAAAIFDGVRYGGHDAGPADGATIRSLDEAVAAATPARPEADDAIFAVPR
jgi:hypothetical protein